jgi:hypothetical protein
MNKWTMWKYYMLHYYLFKKKKKKLAAKDFMYLFYIFLKLQLI